MKAKLSLQRMEMLRAPGKAQDGSDQPGSYTLGFTAIGEDGPVPQGAFVSLTVTDPAGMTLGQDYTIEVKPAK